MLPVQAVPEAVAFHVGHGKPEEAVRFPGVEHGQDVRVLEAGGELDLPLESLGPQAGGEFGQEDFERYRPVVLEIVGQEDGGHAATPQLALDDVAAAESVSELSRGVGQWRARL